MTEKGRKFQPKLLYMFGSENIELVLCPSVSDLYITSRDVFGYPFFSGFPWYELLPRYRDPKSGPEVTHRLLITSIV